MIISRNFCGAFLMATLAAGGANALSVDLDPTSAGPFAVGDPISLEMRTSDDFPTFPGFQGDLDFDPTKLELISIDINPLFDFQDIAGDFSMPPVNVTGLVFFGPADPSGETLLATFNFEALMDGVAAIDFSLVIPDPDPMDMPIFEGVAGTSVTIGDPTTVPVPAAAMLLLSSLLVLPAVRRVAGSA